MVFQTCSLQFWAPTDVPWGCLGYKAIHACQPPPGKHWAPQKQMLEDSLCGRDSHRTDDCGDFFFLSIIFKSALLMNHTSNYV